MRKMGLGMGCLMPLSTLIHLYCGGQFFMQITDKLDHIKGEMRLPFIDSDLLYR